MERLPTVTESEEFAMTEYLYSEKEVREMWKRTKAEQVQIAQAKCIEAIVRTDGKIAVTFSGGRIVRLCCF